MQRGTVIDLNPSLALHAARVSLEANIPMADSVMLATARTYGATLWTQDSDFEKISNVKYVAKK